ncbi:NUDIX hydrolase [Haladaptatus sp. ZSTT2]|uniref:NUDIX hydrolase n=1 Tax=Haladaptatus sp. ZSTT2 TaxID=3120515 RepID=UPI00300F4984
MTDPLEWETLATETAYTCPGFDVTHEDVRLPDGTESDFDYLSEPPAVVILPFTPDGDVVLIEEWRQAVKRVNRGLPAGTMEPEDDDPAAAAHRELEEETGHEAARVDHLTTVEPVNGIANAVHHYFVAYDCHPASEQNLDFNESIRVVIESYDDLLAAIESGEIRDGRAVLGTLYYERFA